MASKSIVLIAIGSNTSGKWGSPSDCLARAVAELNFTFNGLTKVSPFIVTNPLGFIRQPDYLNAVMRVETSLPPAKLLIFLKDLERQAGRRTSASTRWGPRPLDLDIIDHGRRVNGWYAKNRRLQTARRPNFLILPHPEAHLRRFVLEPLLKVEPNWWHPVLRLSGRQLLNRLSQQQAAMSGRRYRPT